MEPVNLLTAKNRDELRDWLMINHAKEKQRGLFESRLQKFLENTRLGIMYGEWNDNGRLL